jgi:hypothetical protein
MPESTKSPAEVLGADWRFDVENAPRGRSIQMPGPKGSTRTIHQPDLVILASADGKTVTVSRWIPAEGRWNMLGTKEQPVAWMPYPTHPSQALARGSEA